MAKKLLLLLAVVILIAVLISRPVVVRRQVDLPHKATAITFLSDRLVQVEYGITAGSSIHTLLTMNADGSDVSYLKGTATSLSTGTWSPTGAAFAIVAFDDELENFCLTIFDAHGRRCVVESGFAPSWSPDGKYIAYTTYSRESAGIDRLVISMIDVSNGAVIPLVSFLLQKTQFSPITWSPDGKAIAFTLHQGEQAGAIWMVDIARNQLTRLTSGLFPVWSPTGKEMAFSRNGDIWLHELATRQEALFVDDPQSANPTGWSPDGQQLLFTSTRDGNSEVYRINRDGTNLINLTNNEADDFGAVWHPLP